MFWKIMDKVNTSLMKKHIQLADQYEQWAKDSRERGNYDKESEYELKADNNREIARDIRRRIKGDNHGHN